MNAEQLSIWNNPDGVKPTFKLSLEAVTDCLTDLERRQAGARVSIPTGFIDLDHVHQGLDLGDLTIIGGPLDLDKSRFALNIASNAAIRYGVKTGLFYPSYSANWVTQQLLSSQTGVTHSRLATARLNEQESRRLAHSMGVLSEMPCAIDDSRNLSLQDLATQMALIRQQLGGLELVVVDNLEQLKIPKQYHLARSLRELAQTFNVALVGTTQTLPTPRFNRRNQFAEQADLILMMSKSDDPNHRGIIDVQVLGRQRGITAGIKLFFNEQTGKYADLEPFRE
jgi:replicative DNA helicase